MCGLISTLGVIGASWGWDCNRLTRSLGRVINNSSLTYIQFWNAKDNKIESFNIQLDINIRNEQTLVDIMMRVGWPAHEPGYKQSFIDIHSVIYNEENLIVTALNKLKKQTLNSFQYTGCDWHISTCNSILTSKNEQALRSS